MKKLIFVSLGALAFFGLGFTFRDLERGKLPSSGVFAALIGQKDASAPTGILKHSYNLISDSYYKPVKGTPLKYAAISGMMASLGDPHTMFLPPKEKADFEFTTTAKFVGIGCALLDDPKGVKLSEVFEGSPAEKAGLQVGDVITAVEGESIIGKPRTKVVDHIRGEAGTTVHLSVIKTGNPTPVQVEVKRAPIFTPTVRGKYLADQKVGYISIATFSEPTVDQFDQQLEKLRQHDLTGLVIDVRGNPGGLLETAVDLLSRFVENKTVVKMRHRDGSEEIAQTQSGYLANLHIPIAILMNEDSASAAEIFSGCMKDYGIATLVGTHSYGKASVQNIFPMIDSAGVKVTIARYYLPITPDIGRKVDPDGQYISGGLQPDVPVKANYDSQMQPGDPKTDVQLAKAIEAIQGKRAL